MVCWLSLKPALRNRKNIMQNFVDIVNPHTEKSSIVVNGVAYSVDAGGIATSIPREIAEKWIGIHQFLVIKEVGEQVDKELQKVEEAEVVVKPTKVEKK
jgi:hypothetical protein